MFCNAMQYPDQKRKPFDFNKRSISPGNVGKSYFAAKSVARCGFASANPLAKGAGGRPL
jgi:hypothetical protein